MAVSANKRSIMTLYSGAIDPYSHRVRIVLAEKGVTYDIVDVDGSVKAVEELAGYNPYGTIPTLVDRDLVLYKSEIIMEYLDERFPHPPLMPVYPVAKGRSRLMIHRVNQDWYSLMDTILKPGESPKEIEQARKSLTESLTSVIPVFAEMPFFLSEEFSLIDCCIAPLLWRLPRLGVELPPQAQPVLSYAERVFKRDSFQASLTDAERMMRT
jgi:RNA polymerase-associated protein